MKAILIDPWKRSLETIEIQSGNGNEPIRELYKLVGEEGLDWAGIADGEAIYLGDHSALHIPPWPFYTVEGFGDPLYGRGVVIGYDGSGKSRDTRLTVDDLSQLITWNEV